MLFLSECSPGDNPSENVDNEDGWAKSPGAREGEVMTTAEPDQAGDKEKGKSPAKKGTGKRLGGWVRPYGGAASRNRRNARVRITSQLCTDTRCKHSGFHIGAPDP